MDSRTELHEILCKIINITELDGDRHTYYQPPASVGMKYPAIVYSRKSPSVLYASNAVYKRTNAYELTVIDEDPDSEIVKKVMDLPYCRHERHFTSDNLNHDVFTIFY